MLIRTLGMLPLTLLLFASSAHAQLGGSPIPVDFTNTSARTILWEAEATICDVSVRPNQTGCTTTSNDPEAIFPTPAVEATLSFLGGNVAEIRIDASIWDQVLFETLDDPVGGVIYQLGSASDYVLTIDTTTGLAIDYGWTATTFWTSLASNVDVEASLVAGGGAEAYGGVLTSGGAPVAVVCGSGGISGGPITGECTGANFVPNEAYDPVEGTLSYAAQNLLVAGLFPQQWAPIDIRLSEIVVPDPSDRFNLDIGTRGSFLPSNRYAGGAGEAGVWNETGNGVTELVNTQGVATTARVNIPSGSTLGIAGPRPTTNDEFLLFDNLTTINPGDAWIVDFSGLSAQSYDVLLYAPSNSSVATGAMSVNRTAVPSLVGDPGGTLTGGTSFVVVSVFAAGGTIEISGSDAGFSGLAGVQLVPSPEPSGPVVMAIGITALSCLARRRRGAASVPERS